MLFKENNLIKVGKKVEILKKLPPKVYIILKNGDRYVLKETNSFNLPEKIYGDEDKFADRVLKTFENSNSNIGVLLSGRKGTGKTLTAKLICKKSNLPVILINNAYTDEGFISFLSDIGGEVIILIDEFEKVYKEEEQEYLLPILDGIFDSKKLFIFTTKTLMVNDNLKSRPSRIRYLKEYTGLDIEIIEEIIDDNLINKDNKEDLILITQVLSSTSIDILLTLVNEMNLYDISAQEAVNNMNIQVEFGQFDVIIFHKGKRSNSRVHFNPLTKKKFWLEYKHEDMWEYVEIDMSNMDISIEEGEYVFTSKDGKSKFRFIPSDSYKFNLDKLNI